MVLKYVTDVYNKTVSLTHLLSIGRSLDNELVLEGDEVDERHAGIEKKGDRYLLRDLNSGSGTFLNGVSIKEEYLNIGDRLAIGHHVFEVESKEITLRSRCRRWQSQLAKIPAFAKTDLSILLLGPSGSGKEVLSKCIHRNSQRVKGPLITVNCSALTESLSESELFGHVKGAFTGATQDRKGAFESAKFGTLILDEIGDLPIKLQPKLLRALDNMEIKPVGSDKTVKTNVRIIACTHQDLKRKVELGEFRLDLFYRLNVIQINVPPLIERMEDFDDILVSLCKEQRLKIRDSAAQELKNHSWPGNIRELKNIVYRLKAIRGEDCVKRDDILQALEVKTFKTEGYGSLDVPSRRGSSRSNIIKEIEKQIIIKQLLINGGNQSRTANDLGIPRSTLNDRVRDYDIDVEKILREKFGGDNIIQIGAEANASV